MPEASRGPLRTFIFLQENGVFTQETLVFQRSSVLAARSPKYVLRKLSDGHLGHFLIPLEASWPQVGAPSARPLRPSALPLDFSGICLGPFWIKPWPILTSTLHSKSHVGSQSKNTSGSLPRIPPDPYFPAGNVVFKDETLIFQGSNVLAARSPQVAQICSQEAL